MLSLGIGARVVLATEPVDLRRGHDGLISLVRSRWTVDPYSGTLFVFFGRRGDRVKILFFAAGGFVVYYKRLERGRFTMPVAEHGATSITLDGAALAMLLEGIDLSAVKRPALWTPKNDIDQHAEDRHSKRVMIKARCCLRLFPTTPTTITAAPGAITR